MRNPFDAPRSAPGAPRPPALHLVRGWLLAALLFIPIGVLIGITVQHPLSVRDGNLDMDALAAQVNARDIAIALAYVLGFILLNPLVARGLGADRARSIAAFLLGLSLALVVVAIALFLVTAIVYVSDTPLVKSSMWSVGSLLYGAKECVLSVEARVLPVSLVWFLAARPAAPDKA